MQGIRMEIRQPEVFSQEGWYPAPQLVWEVSGRCDESSSAWADTSVGKLNWQSSEGAETSGEMLLAVLGESCELLLELNRKTEDRCCIFLHASPQRCPDPGNFINPLQ